MKIRMILFSFFTPLLFATTCINKEMRENTIIVDNQLDVRVYLVPYRITYDYFNSSLTKGTLMVDTEYIVDAKFSKKIFYTPFCMKNYWDKMVVGDTLEILVFQEDALTTEETLEQLINRKAYAKSLKMTFDQLNQEGCKVIVSP